MDPKLDESAIRKVVEDVLQRLDQSKAAQSTPAVTMGNRRSSIPSRTTQSNRRRPQGIFDDAYDACEAAEAAFLQLREAGLDGRNRVVRIIKELCAQKANEWGKLELEETKIGRLDHKIEKLQIIDLVPGVEWLRPYGMSGDHGITLEEYTPFGVIGAITPITHSIPTLSSNVISIVAAGNSAVFNPHPGGARCATVAVRAFNEAIHRELGIENLICSIEHPTLESFDALCRCENVPLLTVTGGPGVVNAAMRSGKRAICAGPGNPPVLVDESADIQNAVTGVIKGAVYDNNLLCIGEKEVYVVDAVFSAFVAELKRQGAVGLTDTQLDRLSAAAFAQEADAGGCSHAVLNRDLVGQDPSVLAEQAGVRVSSATELLFAETPADHVFVMEEQMMPMVPVVRVGNVEEGIAHAVEAEHGYKHSSMIHSRNVENMTAMARALDTTLFVKNGPSMAGLGLGGEGYLSYSIATATGEGITTPKTFTRTRRCVMVDNLRIY